MTMKKAEMRTIVVLARTGDLCLYRQETASRQESCNRNGTWQGEGSVRSAFNYFSAIV